MSDREQFWQDRLQRLGNPNFAGPVLVCLAIEEASKRIVAAIENARAANSGAVGQSREDEPSSGQGEPDDST